MNCDARRPKRSRTAVRLPRAFGPLMLVLTVYGISIRAADQSTDTGPNEVRKLIRKAVKLTRGESLVAAESILRQVLVLNPANSAAKVELAFLLTKRRRLTEAYNLAFPVAEAEPANARAFAVLGNILLIGGRFREARALFFNAIRLDRRQHLAWAGYGMIDFYENRISESLANLNEATYQAPDEPDHLFALAQVSSRAERYTEAADAFRHFLNVSSINDKVRRARIVSLIEFLRFLSERSSLYRSVGSDSTEVGFELDGNRPVLEVRVNDLARPLRFVLDTGSGITVISDKTAALLKIKPITRGGHAKGIGGDGKFEVVYGFLQKLDIGDIAMRNVPVYIRPFHNANQTVDGYLGLSLVSKFLTTVDYGTKRFILSKRDDDRRDFLDGNELSLPLRLTSSGFLSGEVMVEGIESPLNFIIDTGASVSVISDQVANNQSIVPFANDEKLRVIGAAGVTEDVQSFMLPKVTFGPHSRKQIAAIALDLDIINEASGFEQAGILGGNFLKNYRMTFDFRNSKVILRSIIPDN